MQVVKLYKRESGTNLWGRVNIYFLLASGADKGGMPTASGGGKKYRIIRTATRNEKKGAL